MGRRKHNWSVYLRDGETLETVSVDTLKKRKFDALGGVKTSRAEKARLNKLQAALEVKAAQGRLLDPALNDLTDALTKLANTQDRADRAVLLDMIWFGASIIRAFNFQKESVQQVADVEELHRIWGSERGLPYSEQIHAGHFVDSQTSEFIGFARSVQLPPEFIKFEVDVLRQVLAWADSHPENFEHRKAIEQELQARLDGRDTAFQRPIAAPAPPALAQEPPKKLYSTGEDMDVVLPPPSLTQLSIENFKEHGGRLDWSKLEEQEVT